MWFYFVKLSESKTAYRLAYGFESKETTGEVEYDKSTGKVSIIKLGSDSSDFFKSRLCYAAYQYVTCKGALTVAWWLGADE